MDEGYKYLIKTFTPLNHDRYKTYFTQFIVVHFGLFIAISKQFEKIKVSLCVIGIILSIAWFLVLLKISLDINKTWKAIKYFENSSDCQQKIRVTGIGISGIPASVIMLSIPVIFAAVYVLILLTPC